MLVVSGLELESMKWKRGRPRGAQLRLDLYDLVVAQHDEDAILGPFVFD